MVTFPPSRPTAGKGSPYDVMVIGAGPGGYVAAIRAAQMGARVIVIEKDNLGGTCLNRGCIPTKAFLSDVKPLQKTRKSPLYEGNQGLSINMEKMVVRKKEVVETMAKGIATLFESNGIHWINGVGSLLDSKTVGVTRRGKKETCRANNIIIGTGSRVGTIPDVTIDGRNILSSDEILDITEIPREMVIIGGGVIGGKYAAHKAMKEGVSVAKQMTGEEVKINYQLIPMCLYTHPQVACIGLTQEEAEEKGEDVEIGYFPFAAGTRAAIFGQTEGIIKVVAERKYGEVLGVHIIGPQATELISLASLSMTNELSVRGIKEAVCAHPYFAENFLEAINDTVNMMERQ